MKELGKRESGGMGKKEELRAVQDPPPLPPSTLSPCGGGLNCSEIMVSGRKKKEEERRRRKKKKE